MPKKSSFDDPESARDCIHLGESEDFVDPAPSVLQQSRAREIPTTYCHVQRDPFPPKEVDDNVQLNVSEVEAIEADFAGATTRDETQLSASTRPEYIYCRVVKKTVDTKVGLKIKSQKVRDENGKVSFKTFISRIDNDGLFGNLLDFLQPQDFVISINHVNTWGKSCREIAKLIRESVDYVSITVRNRHGDPSTFASIVQKPGVTSPVGVSFRNNATGSSILKIRDVDLDGLFAGSLLVPGHRCLFINDTSCANNMPASNAAQLVDDLETVTIISSQPASGKQYAVVLCEENETMGRLRRVKARAATVARAILGDRTG